MEAAANENGVSTGCMQEETTFTYECTVDDTIGIGSTNWLCDTFMCTETSNQIRLTHSLYEMGESVVCGNFSATSVSVSGTEYTSELSFFGEFKLNGTIINCTYSGIELVKTIVVIVGGEI